MLTIVYLSNIIAPKKTKSTTCNIMTMAKKTYLQPQIMVVTVQHEHVLATSGGTPNPIGCFDENNSAYDDELLY